MVHAPKLGLEVTENMIPLIISSFLTGCGVNLEYVVTALPSAGILKIIMLDEAMDTVYLENQEMRGVPLILLDNKCDGHGNQGSTYFVKLVAQMDEVRDRIKVTCI